MCMNEDNNNKERLDVMLDMETLGTKEGSIILSVAMQTFSPDVQKPPREDFDFYEHISVLDSLWHHFRSDESTEEWWGRQSEEAKQKALEGQKNAQRLQNVMCLLHKVLTQWNEKYDLYLWGRGVGSFDLPLLDTVMRNVMKEMMGDAYKTPWNYWAAMDVRSVENFCQVCGMEKMQTVTPHDAREDVMKQIKEVQMCWQYVKIERAI